MRRQIAVGLLLLLEVGAAAGQAPRTPALSVSVDPGLAIPLGEFADDGAELGWSVGVSAALRLTRLLGIYAAWERTTFDVAEAAAAGADSWTDSGLGAGVRLWIPRDPESRLQPWVQLGIGQHDLDRPLADSAFSALDTDAVRTLEAGAGLDFAVVRQTLFLRPTVRFRRYSFDLESAAQSSSTSISYLSLALGVGVLIGPRGDVSPASPR